MLLFELFQTNAIKREWELMQAHILQSTNKYTIYDQSLYLCKL